MFGFAVEFWKWWIGQLVDLLPDFDRRNRRGAALILVPELPIQPGHPAVTARVEEKGRVKHLGRFVVDETTGRAIARAASSEDASVYTVIEMATGAMLEKRLVLPIAAERELDRILSYEIDRETPFSSDEIYWGGQLIERDRVHGRITVQLAMVAKNQLAELIAALTNIGISPKELIGTHRDGSRTLLPIEHAQSGQSRAGRLAAFGAAGLCLALAIAAITIPFVNQGQALASVEERIDQLRPLVASVERLRDRIDADRTRAERLGEQRSLYVNPLVMLAALTAALPDDSHLTELEYSSGKLVISGMSKQAAHLIGDISRSPLLRDPSFSAPVTRMEQSDYDVFSITANVGR